MKILYQLIVLLLLISIKMIASRNLFTSRRIILFNRIMSYTNPLHNTLTVKNRCMSDKSSYSQDTTDNVGQKYVKICASAADIEVFGQHLGDFLDVGDVVLLHGDLGAGKTTLSRGVIRSKLNDETVRVTSPTYLLDNIYQYDKDKCIHHMDLYRLPNNSDLSILDIPNIFDKSLCIIEWSQRIDRIFYPVNYLDIEISIDCNTEYRTITIIPSVSNRNKLHNQLVKLCKK